MDNRFNRNHFIKDEESLIDFATIINIIIGKWYWFLFSILIFISIGGLYIYKSPKYYKKTATILIKDQNSIGSVSGAASTFTDLAGVRMLSSANTDNEISILQSRSLMESVVLRLKSYIVYYRKSNFRYIELYERLPFRLIEESPGNSMPISFYIEPITINEFNYSDNDTTFIGEFNKDILFPFGKAKIDSNPEIVLDYIGGKIRIDIISPKAIANSYLSSLKVSQISKMGTIVSLNFISTRPGKSEDVLNTLLDQYNRRSIEDKNVIIDATVNFITARLDLIKDELSDIDLRIEEYKKTNKTIGVNSESSLYLQNANVLEEKLSLNSIQIELINNLYDFINDPINKRELIPYNIGLDNVVLNKQIQEYNENLIKLNRMITASSERNPFVMDLTTMLSSTRTTIENSIVDLKRSLDLQQKELFTRSNKASGRIEAVSVNERNVQSIAREQKIKEELYLYLLNKKEESSITKSMTESNGSIVDYADGNNYPISPQKSIIIFLSLVLGIGLPCCYFVIVDLIYTKVRGRTDLTNILTAPILGEIPSKNKKIKETLIVRSGDNSHVSEAFRILRTNLSFLPNEPKVIAVTSSQSNEGKTYITMNLAKTLALAGKKVCMLDLDLRRRSLSNHFLLLKKEGVVEYLMNKNLNIESMLCDVDEECNLKMLPAGHLCLNPAELLMGNCFDEMMKQLREKFDYILIDNPPLNIVADTKITNRCTDLTIYIIRAGVLDRKDVRIVEDIYISETLKNMGVVLTDVDYERLYYSLGYKGYGKAYGTKYAVGKYYN